MENPYGQKPRLRRVRGWLAGGAGVHLLCKPRWVARRPCGPGEGGRLPSTCQRCCFFFNLLILKKEEKRAIDVLFHLVLCSLVDFFFLKIIYLFLDKGEGREKERERNISVWLPLPCSLLGTLPATQACALGWE